MSELITSTDSTSKKNIFNILDDTLSGVGELVSALSGKEVIKENKDSKNKYLLEDINEILERDRQEKERIFKELREQDRKSKVIDLKSFIKDGLLGRLDSLSDPIEYSEEKLDSKIKNLIEKKRISEKENNIKSNIVELQSNKDDIKSINQSPSKNQDKETRIDFNPFIKSIENVLDVIKNKENKDIKNISNKEVSNLSNLNTTIETNKSNKSNLVTSIESNRSNLNSNIESNEKKTLEDIIEEKKFRDSQITESRNLTNSVNNIESFLNNNDFNKDFQKFMTSNEDTFKDVLSILKDIEYNTKNISSGESSITDDIMDLFPSKNQDKETGKKNPKDKDSKDKNSRSPKGRGKGFKLGKFGKAGLAVAGIGAITGIGSLFSSKSDTTSDTVNNELISSGDYSYKVNNMNSHLMSRESSSLNSQSNSIDNKLENTIGKESSDTTKNLSKQAGKSVAKNTAKSAAKLGAKAIPIVGQALLAAEAIHGIGSAAYELSSDPDSYKITNILESNGVIEKNIFGNSDIHDWNSIENLSSSNIDSLIRWDDWSKKDKARLESIRDKNKELEEKEGKVFTHYDVGGKERSWGDIGQIALKNTPIVSDIMSISDSIAGTNTRGENYLESDPVTLSNRVDNINTESNSNIENSKLENSISEITKNDITDSRNRTKDEYYESPDGRVKINTMNSHLLYDDNDIINDSKVDNLQSLNKPILKGLVSENDNLLNYKLNTNTKSESDINTDRMVNSMMNSTSSSSSNTVINHHIVNPFSSSMKDNFSL